MARRRCFCGAATVALAVLGLGAARDVSAQTYLVTEIAPPVGHTHTVATGLNLAGIVVGYSFSTAVNSDAFTSILGYRWSGGTTTSITPLGGKSAGIAYGINALGEAVGTSFNISGDSFVGIRAFLDLPAPHYSLPLGPNDIGDLGGGEAAAYGINDSGYVVGESLDNIDPNHAFLWLPTGFSSPFGGYSTPGMKDLGTLGGANSVARGINSLGQIVGGSATTEAEFKSFLWMPSASAPYAAGLNNLGSIAPAPDSIAFGISEGTVVAGYSFTGSLNASSRAIRYDHGVKTQYTPFAGGSFSGANGINSYDQLAGVSTVSSSDTSQTAAMLISSGKKYNLNSLIAGGQGWTLIEAMAIGDNGKIVGYGSKLQNDLSVPTRGFVLTPNFSLQPNTNVPGAMNAGDSTSLATVNLDHSIGIDVLVKLSSDNAHVHVPTGVVIPAGSSSATFTISTDLTATGTAHITAKLNGVTQTSTINITPAFILMVTNLNLNPSTVAGGSSTLATVTLNGNSVGTTNVPLSKIGFANGGLSGSLPSISVANGQNTGSVNIPTLAVTNTSTGTIRATLNGNADAALTIVPLKVASVTFAPLSPVIGGDDITVTVTMSAAAPPAGVNVNLTYSASGYPFTGSQPATLAIPGNATSASFVLHTQVVSTRATGWVQAKYSTTPAVKGNLKIDPIGVSGLVITPNPAHLSAGTTSAVATIMRPAPAGGWMVRFSTSAASKADFAAGATSQATIDVLVPAGQTQSPPVTIYLNAKGTPNITAYAPPQVVAGGKGVTVSLPILSP